MAYVLACLLGLLAAGQASIISTAGLSGYNSPVLSQGHGLLPLGAGALGQGHGLHPLSTGALSQGHGLLPLGAGALSQGHGFHPLSTGALSQGHGLLPLSTGALSQGHGLPPLSTGALGPYVHHTAPFTVQNQYAHAVAGHVVAGHAVAAPAVAAYAAPVAAVAAPAAYAAPVAAPAPAAYAAPVAAVAAPAAYAAPVAAVAAPVAAVAPVVAPVEIKTQYHSQDEQGRYRFGYTDGQQSRDEQRDAYGRVTGSYSYIDEYGQVNSQAYVADEGGFRVTGNNLPVHHVGKRSLTSYPASVGPLVHGYRHHVPAIAHPGYHVAPEIRTVHQVSAHVAAPVAHVAAPVAYAAAPIAHHVAAPIAHHVAAPVAHHVASPVAHGHYGGYAVPNRVSYATHGSAVPVYG